MSSETKTGGAPYQQPKTWVTLLSSIIGAAAIIWAAVISSNARHDLNAKDTQIRELKKQVQDPAESKLKQEVVLLREALAAKETEVRQLRATVAQLESQLKNDISGIPDPVPLEPRRRNEVRIQDFVFSLESCERGGGNLTCWFRATNDGGQRNLNIFEDKSWLRDRSGNTYDQVRVLKSNGDRDFNIHEINLPEGSSARFGLQFVSVRSSVTSVMFLRVHTSRFDIDFNLGLEGFQVNAG